MTTFLIILFLVLFITCIVLGFFLKESMDECARLMRQVRNAEAQVRNAEANISKAWTEMETRQANLRRFLQSLRDRLKHSLLQREGPKSIGNIVDTEFEEWWERWNDNGGK